MKLRGILDSKGRRETWLRNLEPAGPKEPDRLPPAEIVHVSEQLPDGSFRCCGRKYSEAAHALHLKGERLTTCCGGVMVADLSDPWLLEADARLKAERNEAATDDAAVIRAEQVDLYYKQLKKATARRVSGADHWMAE